VEELKAIGVERVILFGSVVCQTIGLTSDLDLLVIWDTPMGFLERTAFLYRRLNPRVPVDLFVYTPEEIRRLADHPFIRQALAEGETVYAAGSEGGGPPLA
jgi:predicted nucleotidyltransferase